MATCLHTLFEEQVKKYPNLTAIKYSDYEITYNQLDEKSNQLANYLIEHGVKPGDKVCILIKRSIEMMIGILGVLKSGAAYVPIDPKTPVERLNFLLDDADSTFFITHSDLFREIECAQQVVLIDKDKDTISKFTKNSPTIRFEDEKIAVILYTSGSTGYPKGVLLSHISLVNRLLWDREQYKHTEEDVILHHASYTFDLSILEIFMALANGGKLIMARPDFHYESFYLIELIQKEKITKTVQGPSLLNAYIDIPSFENCTSLKQFFLGGETLRLDLQEKFFKKSTAELINVFGPTEGSMSILNWTCKRDSEEKFVPIGFPVANVTIYLLDENNEPVADGEPGEIFISGISVANGYHKNPELTAQHFLKDPFSSAKNARMYKSGDFAKKLPNGAYQFLGRKDQQLQVHGRRIELQEIEYYIIKQECISACVVTAFENKSGKIKLVAYVVPNNSKELNIDEVITSLKSSLPEYMVPSLFVKMSEFPISAHGKIDRKSLPYPDDVRLLSGVEYEPPTNETQHQLVKIWEDVLEFKSIGITDSFYNIGGDSLSALEIHTKMESEMGCKLPLSFFENAYTIQEQSAIIQHKLKAPNSARIIQLRDTGNRPPIVFIGPAQSIGIALHQSLLKYINSDHPFLAILPFGADAKDIPESIEEIARYYVQLLEDNYSIKKCIIGGSSMGGLIAYEMAVLLKNKGVTVQLLFLVDTFHPKAMTNNHYHISKRFSFYKKKLVKCNNKERRIIIKHLYKVALNAILGIFNRKEAHPALYRFKGLLSGNAKMNKPIAENKNLSLAVRYQPIPAYAGKVLILSVKVDENSPIYLDELFQHEREESLKKWKDEILDGLFVYEILGTHTSIMKEPNIEIVANVINDHAS